MRDLHMVANAHIDPIWQWTWEEGAAEGISTFRAAADLCDEHDAFVFNSNESQIYQWVEKYEPSLFGRIQRLVKEGKWHIIGGWFLQPDCNQPSGESFVRQILTGNKYFYEKFGVKARTALNFDAFGHSRGLVQILAKSGYDSYLFCRPDGTTVELPEEFQWLGFDGSRILAHHAKTFYCTEPDQAANKIEHVAQHHPNLGLVFWGVGNHGGGASREDLRLLDELKLKLAEKGVNIIHSSIRPYIQTRLEEMDNLPEFSKPLWPCFTGCYTTHIRIKQQHRKLESELLLTEKMASHAHMLGLMAYPKGELAGALYDLLFSEFHDALPGTSIQKGEEEILRMIGHGLETLAQIRMQALMHLSAGTLPSQSGDVTILAYNPHPYPVKDVWKLEASPHRPLWQAGFRNPVLYMDGERLPCQCERHDMHDCSYDWRKGFSFEATLKPSAVSLLVCKFEVIPEKPTIQLKEEEGVYHFKTEELEVIINAETGLMDKYAIKGERILKTGAFLPLVMDDSHDSWNFDVSSYRNIAGEFTMASPEDCAKLSGILSEHLPGVHVVEDGEVRTIIEAVFTYERSVLCQRYILPKRGTEIRVETRVYWNERRKMLKLVLPTKLLAPTYHGQTAYGVENMPTDGRETISQRWLAVHNANRSKALTVIHNGGGASDVIDGELRMTLLRSPAYCANFSIDSDRYPEMPPDRFNLYTEQGERFFSFRINAGDYDERMNVIARETQIMHEAPVFVPFTPPGTGTIPPAMITLSNRNVELTAVKKAEASDEFVVRLFEPTGKAQVTEVELPALGIKDIIHLGAYEIVTLITDTKNKRLEHTDLLEGMIK